MKHTDTLMWQEISQTPKIFGEIERENAVVMKNLVKAIKSGVAKNFVAAARGASDYSLIFFKYVLEVNSEYTVGLAAPSVVTLYRGKINYSSSIVIGCSQDGQAEDILEVIKKANEQGAITIAVTNDTNSPMAKEAKYHLHCCAGQEKSFIETKTFSAQLFILLWLAAELASNKEQLLYLKNLGKELEKIIPQIDEKTTKYANKFKDMQSGYIISRGVTYPLALEASSMIQETSFIQMKGCAWSDFYHRPIALVNNTTPVIIYCAENTGDAEIKNLFRSDQINCIEKILSLGAPVLLVTNDVLLAGKFTKCNDALIDFSVSEEICMFAFTLFAQMFACKLSCVTGNNPDSPNALSK